jgi:hypothetical protein
LSANCFPCRPIVFHCRPIFGQLFLMSTAIYKKHQQTSVKSRTVLYGNKAKTLKTKLGEHSEALKWNHMYLNHAILTMVTSLCMP